MDLKVEVKELDELNRELLVEIAADVFNESMEKEYVEVRKKVVLKGFRKGKAPMNTIKSNYGDQVKADVIDKLVKDTYPQAVREKELRVHC
jgi:trigger factor